MLFKMVLGGILDRPTARIIKTMASPRDQKFLHKNTATTIKKVSTIFIRASIRCTGESPGKY